MEVVLSQSLKVVPRGSLTSVTNSRPGKILISQAKFPSDKTGIPSISYLFIQNRN